MSTILSPSGVELPDGGEPHSRAQVNRDLTKINDLWQLVPLVNVQGSPMAGTAKPANNAYKRFSGLVTTTTGAGGDTQTAANATDAGGLGGWWFGAQGIPSFQGIYSVQLTAYHSLTGFAYAVNVVDVSLTRIKFFAWRFSPAGVANGYGSISMLLDVVGW